MCVLVEWNVCARQLLHTTQVQATETRVGAALRDLDKQVAKPNAPTPPVPTMAAAIEQTIQRQIADRAIAAAAKDAADDAKEKAASQKSSTIAARGEEKAK